MSSGTNQERIEQNNLKLAQLKTKADNLPEYQDIEPVYATLDITLNYKMSKTNISYLMDNCFVGNEWAIFTSSSYTPSNNPKIYIYYKGTLINSFNVNTYVTLPWNLSWILTVLNITNTEIVFCLYRASTNSIYTFKYNRNTNLVTYVGLLNLTIYWGRNLALSTSTPEINTYNNYGVASIRFFEETNIFCVNGKSSNSDSSGSYLSLYKYNTSDNTIEYVAYMGQYAFPISPYFAINTYNSQYSGGYLYKLFYNEGYSTINYRLYPNDLDVNGVNYLGNKVFKNGNVYTLNSDLSIGTLLKENIYEVSTYAIEAVNDKFYRYKNKLYTFDEETNTFTELGENFYWSGSTIYKLVDNYIEVYKFERGQEQIGSIYNNIFIPIMDGSFIESNEIINGKLAYNELHQQVIGTMPNNGALSYTPSTSQQTIPAGYTSGGTIAGVTSDIDNNIIAENIKKNITILNVTGTYEGAGIKTYASEIEMNNDIANISTGEVVKVTAGPKFFIKEIIESTPTMTELVKVTETITPEEYEENIDLADAILGEEQTDDRMTLQFVQTLINNTDNQQAISLIHSYYPNGLSLFEQGDISLLSGDVSSSIITDLCFVGDTYWGDGQDYYCMPVFKVLTANKYTLLNCNMCNIVYSGGSTGSTPDFQILDEDDTYTYIIDCNNGISTSIIQTMTDYYLGYMNDMM